jgi:hypothetical protein
MGYRPSLHGLTVRPSRPACRRQAASAAWPFGPCGRAWPSRPFFPARPNRPVQPAQLQYKRGAVRVSNPNRCLPTKAAAARPAAPPVLRRRIPPLPRRPQPPNTLQVVDPPCPFLIHHRSQALAQIEDGGRRRLLTRSSRPDMAAGAAGCGGANPRRLVAVWRRSSPQPSSFPPERELRRSSGMGAAAGSRTSVTVDEVEPALPPPTAVLLKKMEVRASPRKEKHGPHLARRRVRCSEPRSSGSPASERRRAQVLATEERTVRAGR